MSQHTAFVESGVRQAADFRDRQGHPLDATVH